MIRLSRFVLVLAAVFSLVRVASAAAMNMNSEILSSYVKISSALAADDLAAAKTAAASVAEHAGMSDNKDIASKANALAKATKIDAARSAFKSLSDAVVPLAANASGYVVMSCPMVRADWVQTSKDVKNPYMGKAMLTCGGPKAPK